MKKILITVFALSISAICFAQQKIPSNTEIQDFLKTKTYIVLDNNIFGMWNNAIKEAADENWTITPYEFISPDDFKVKMKRSGTSFIILTTGYFETQEDLGVFSSISVLLGKEKATLNTMPDIAEFPLAFENVDYDEYYYKLGIALRFIQKHIEYLRDNPKVSDVNVMNYYKNAKKSTKEKTLYLVKSDLSPKVNTLTYIKPFYQGKVVITSQEEIETIIKEKREDALILHLVRPDKDINDYLCIKMIIGVSDAELYYFDYHKIKKGKKPGTFLEDDFKSINKQ